MTRIKKHRGLKRYYRNLYLANDLKKADWMDFNNPNIRFDLWHLHFDWRGYGNHSFKKRKPHLDKLFRHFDQLSEKAKSLESEYQIWATILDFDSYNDALFLHTPNPNHKNFPWTIKDLSKTTTLKNKELKNYIDNLIGYEKRYGQAGEAFCVLFKKNVGVGI